MLANVSLSPADLRAMKGRLVSGFSLSPGHAFFSMAGLI